MPRMIYTEENGYYQFDFSAALDASDNLHIIYKSLPLADVDYIVKTPNNDLIFVENKNSTVNQMARRSSFDPSSEKKISNIIRKFYDSLIFTWACDDVLPVDYIYILEYPQGDSTTRKLLREKIMNGLPFEFQKNNADKLKHKLIKSFDILSIDEWNNDPVLGKYPITRTIK